MPNASTAPTPITVQHSSLLRKKVETDQTRVLLVPKVALTVVEHNESNESIDDLHYLTMQFLRQNRFGRDLKNTCTLLLSTTPM